MRRTTKILSLAALTAISSYGSTKAADLTWTGAVSNTWDASNTTAGTMGSLNWISGGAATAYNQGDNATFTDNFTGPTGIDVGTINYTAFNFTGGVNPANLTFAHVTGSTPTNYTFNRYRDNNTSATSATNVTPFGLSNTTTLTLDTGFLGTVILQQRANNLSPTNVGGQNILRGGVLEIQDAGALVQGPNQFGTFSLNTPKILMQGGQLNINPMSFAAAGAGGQTPTNASSTQLAGYMLVSSDSTLAYNSTFENASIYNGTITVASNATLRTTSLTGNSYRYQNAADWQASTGTLLFDNTGTTANVARIDTFRATAPFAALDLGAGSTLFSAAAAPANLVGASGGTIAFGALFGEPNTRILGSNSSTAGIVDSLTIGYKNVDSTFNGTIGDGTATTNARKLSVTKGGTGVLTLTGTNTYSGSVNAAGGTISLGTIGASGVASNAGAGTQVFLTGGALKHTGAAAATTDRLINVTPTGGTLDSSGGGISFTNAAVTAVDVTNRGGYIVPGSNVLSFAPLTANANGLGNTSDLVVGMTVTNSVAFPAGPATITAVGIGTVTLNTVADAAGTISNAAVAFSVADRTLNLTGASTGTIAGTLSNSAGGAKLNLAKSGAGAWTLNGANASTGSVSASGGTLNFGTASNLSSGAISANGGSIVLAAGHVNAEPITSLSIGQTSSALDVTDNDLIISNATPKTTVEGYVRNARDGGLWDGSGLTTSLAKPVGGQQKPFGLGVVSGAEYINASSSNTSFSGKPFSSTDTLVKYTYNGDADLTGNINANDYGHIDSGFQNQNTAGFVFDWYNGDFDYNGTINANDYALIDSAFQLQSGTLRAAINYLETGVLPTGQIPESLQEVIDHNNEFGAVYANAFVFATVPEPVSVGVIAMGAMGAMARRRRRSI